MDWLFRRPSCRDALLHHLVPAQERLSRGDAVAVRRVHRAVAVSCPRPPPPTPFRLTMMFQAPAPGGEGGGAVDARDDDAQASGLWALVLMLAIA